MAELALGIDFGTSGARACVIAGNEEIEALERIDFASAEDAARPAAWDDTLFALIASLPIGLRRKLRHLAIDGTSGSVLATSADGTPLHAALMYHDARARVEAERLTGLAGRTHTVASATSGLAKALWLQARLDRPARYLNQADWLATRLHGQAPVTDYHNALKLGFEIEALRWPDWMTQAIDPALLPRPMAPGSPIGLVDHAVCTRLNLSSDTLVHAGTTDSIAAFLAAGAQQTGEAVTSLGSTLALKLVSDTRVESALHGVYSHWFGTRWLAGGASNAGGAVLAQHFSPEALAALSTQIDPARPSELDYYPLPAPGERFPVNDPGLPPRLTPRPDSDVAFLHGLLEGLARIEAQGYRKLAELGASPLRNVTSCGGGAKNPVYTRIRQRQLGVPVHLAPQHEACFGSARLALQGIALFPR